MKILTIGDIHGYDTWKHALNYWRPNEEKTLVDQYDYIVFVGDYVDDFILPDHQIYKNLIEIVELKKLYPEKVILLWGNHDVQYLLGTKGNGASGYRPSMWLQLHEFFTENRNLFQLAFQIENYLWSHAGVHRGWYQINITQQKYVIRNGEKCEWLELDKTATLYTFNIADILNFCFEAQHQPIFDCGRDRGGSAKCGGPLWLGKENLYKKPLDGYHQIVGHTRINEIKHYTQYTNKNTSTTFVDCMHIDYNNYYIVEL